MTATASNQPTHRVYVVRGNGENSRWTRIGAAWAHRDGKGFSADLDAAPVSGRVVLREITARDTGAQQ
ncbi:MAG TPA: hypothetical protein VK614_02385 [Allosphingosinicella sp.]|nr:hypothetical protein [Allosphingosinicella sp.]